MTTAEQNTKYRCVRCHAVFDFPHHRIDRSCPHCGAMEFEQLVVANVCDFCGTEDSEGWWRYPCGDFAYTFQTPGFTINRSQGHWQACDECHRLIDANDRRGLSRRSIDQHIERLPERAAHRRELFAVVRSGHNDFFAHKGGEPTREEPDVRDG